MYSWCAKYYWKQNQTKFPPNSFEQEFDTVISNTAFWGVWCPNEIKINQIILKKKSNVKTESTLGKQQIPKMISTCRFNNFFCLVHVKDALTFSKRIFIFIELTPNKKIIKETGIKSTWLLSHRINILTYFPSRVRN